MLIFFADHDIEVQGLAKLNFIVNQVFSAISGGQKHDEKTHFGLKTQHYSDDHDSHDQYHRHD